MPSSKLSNEMAKTNMNTNQVNECQKVRQSKAKQRALMLKFPTEIPFGLERIASPFGWLQKHLKKKC